MLKSIKVHVWWASRSALWLYSALLLLACLAYAQPPQAQCVHPLCVDRVDDRATDPVPGMLRYAVREASPGSTITFDLALNGKTIKLDVSSMKNAIRISRDVTLQGPG